MSALRPTLSSGLYFAITPFSRVNLFYSLVAGRRKGSIPAADRIVEGREVNLAPEDSWHFKICPPKITLDVRFAFRADLQHIPGTIHIGFAGF
jgi:hypothetical protein